MNEQDYHHMDVAKLNCAEDTEVNRFDELNKLLREEGTCLTETKKAVLDSNDRFHKIKNEIKCCVERLRVIRSVKHAQGAFGG